MSEQPREIIVGILGQWASGKTTAAETLFEYLGGEDAAVFITDREILAGQAVKHILELEESRVNLCVTEDGRQRLEGELATVFLDPGEDLRTVDLNTLLFDLHDDVYDSVTPGCCSWFDRARLELGSQILQRSAEGKPIVVEVGFGTNKEPRGANPFRHSVADLFERLEEAGVKPSRVKWIIVEADYERRAERNRRRLDSVPAVEFDRFAADGGDLKPEQQNSLEEHGTVIKRVSNDHDDVERFRADIVATFQEMFSGVSSTRAEEGGPP